VVAVDTNVLVRLLVADNAGQAVRAASLFRANRIFIAKSVLLETEWVLRHLYKFRPIEILRTLQRLLGLENVTVEDPSAAADALQMLEKGLDFADALHLASSAQAERFATFDAKLAARAKGVTTLAVMAL
jgi:predicted nucleic-acid-binding protein